jgi:hypothetical protein
MSGPDPRGPAPSGSTAIYAELEAKGSLAVAAGWLARAGFAASTVRWFCGADGNVVAEQDARWSDPVTKAGQGRARVASRFVIHGETVAAHQRHDILDAALTAAGLTAADEVTG